MKLGIVIFPPKDVQDVANDFRKRYDPNYALLSPHITIKEAFEATQDQIPGIVSELRKIARDFQPFSLEITKMSNFYPTNNVIYFAIQDHPTLTKLHEGIHTPEILQHNKKFSFVPHITIGQGMSDDELHDVYSRIKMKPINFQFEVDRFHLLYQLDNLTWSVQQTFNLGEDC